MGTTITKPKKPQIPRIFFFLRWKIGSTITKPKKLQIPRKISLYFYFAAISTITKPQKLQISTKISFYFIVGGEKFVLPSRSQKNDKSHVKFLFILYWAAKNWFYHHEAKKKTNLTKNIFFFIALRKTGSTITNAKKTTNPM